MTINTGLSKRLAFCTSLITALAIAAPTLAQHAGHGTMDMKSMMREHNKTMGAMKMTGDADVDFAMMMRMHHMGGIKMAEHELTHGKDQRMKDMAQKIIDAQKKEIAEFEQFLVQKGHVPAKSNK